MSVKIIFEKSEIFERVNVHTITVSDPVGSKEQNSLARIADVIPLTNDDKDKLYTLMYEAGIRILEYIGAYTTGIDYPYQVTDDTDPEFPDSIVFEMEFYTGAKEGIVIPIVQQSIAESLILYIVKEWLKRKNFLQAAVIVEDQYQESLPKIKSGLMYGQRVKKKYQII